LAEAAYATCASYGWPAVRHSWLKAYSSMLPGPDSTYVHEPAQ
jgi:hypothetical protein